MGRRGASWAQLEASWPQLGPNLSPTKVQHGATWACLDASWGLYAQLGPVWRHLARKLCPMSPSKPKNVGNSGKNASFQRVTLSPQNCPGWARLPQKGCQLGQVALSWTQLEPKLAPSGHVGLKLGAKRSTWFPNWSRVMHMEAEVTSKVAQLGHCGNSFTPTWAQRRHNMRNIASNKRSIIDSKQTCEIPVKKGVMRMSDWAGYVQHVEAIWTSTWAEVAPTWVRLRAKLQYVGGGAEVGAEWVQVGHIWGNFWPKVTPNGADDVAAMSDRQDAFGRCCADMPNAQITTAGKRLLAPRPGRTCPPTPIWSCTSLTDLSVSLAAKLPRLDTFGAGGFYFRVVTCPNVRPCLILQSWIVHD